MPKLIIIFSVLLCTQLNLKGQRVYFAAIENEPYLNRNFSYKIIGNVNDHILIWKHFTEANESVLFIYDQKMKLEKSVSLSHIIHLPLQQIDFLNHGKSFDVIFQLYNKNQYYSLCARFNDKGDLMRPIDTLEIMQRSKQARSEVANFIISENKKHVALCRIVSGDRPGTALLEFLILDDEMHLRKRRKIIIPVSENSQAGPIYMDNSGNIIFPESHRSPDENTTSITIYKIKKNTDSVLSVVNDMGTRYIFNLQINIDERKHEYLVNGVLNNFIKHASTKISRGFFTWLLNDDLNGINADSVMAYDMVNQLNMKEKYMPLYKISEINSTDSGYLITCVPTPYISSPAVSEPIEYTSNDHPFNPPQFGFQLNTNNMGVPTNPIYDVYSAPGQQYNKRYIPTSMARQRPPPIKDKVLLIYKLDNSQHMHFLAKLKGDMEPNLDSKLEEAFIFYHGKETHVIYPKIFESHRAMYSDALINESGKVNINTIISNNLKYKLETSNGVQIDPYSIIFPCEVGGRLGFAKVEYDFNE